LTTGVRPALLEITRSASGQDFHDREDFYIEKRSKSFAIMKGGRPRGPSGFQGRVGLPALRQGEDFS
jgi:hypothetical protein